MIKINSEKALSLARASKLAEINSACDAEISAIKSTYPETEVLSWPKQEREAYALVEDGTAQTPLIDGIAAARGISRGDLAILIIAKTEQFAAATGPIFGKRQVLEKQIEAATTAEEVDAVKWVDA